jgi:hypothetical protein
VNDTTERYFAPRFDELLRQFLQADDFFASKVMDAPVALGICRDKKERLHV